MKNVKFKNKKYEFKILNIMKCFLTSLRKKRKQDRNELLSKEKMQLEARIKEIDFFLNLSSV